MSGFRRPQKRSRFVHGRRSSGAMRLEASSHLGAKIRQSDGIDGDAKFREFRRSCGGVRSKVRNGLEQRVILEPISRPVYRLIIYPASERSFCQVALGCGQDRMGAPGCAPVHDSHGRQPT